MKTIKFHILKRHHVRLGRSSYRFECALCDHTVGWNALSTYVEYQASRHITVFHRIKWRRIKLKTKEVD